MKQDQHFDISFQGKPHYRVEIRVTPASPNVHLLGEVLAVMDQNVGIPAEQHEVLEAWTGPGLIEELDCPSEKQECPYSP